MEARTPEMQRFFDMANEEEFPLAKKSDLETLSNEHKKEHTCMVGNGVKKEMPLNEAVAFLANKVGWFTRPKIIIGIIIFVLSQVFIFGVWKGGIDAELESVEKVMIDIKNDMHTNQEDIKEILRSK